MLPRENLGGCHDACLVAVVKGYQCRHKSDYRLTAAHITLQETVHLLAAAHVVAHLADDTLLCPCERKLQEVVVEVVEVIAHMGKIVPHQATGATFYIMQDIELQEEQLLEFEPELRPLQRLRVAGQVDVVQGFGKRHQVEALHQFGRQGLGDVLHGRRVQDIDHELVYRPGRERAVAQHLGQIVHALQALCNMFIVSNINLGVNDIQVGVEHRRLAIEDILRRGVIRLLNRRHTIEPHHLDGARAIGEQRLQTPFAALAHRVERDEPAPQLHCRLVAMQLIHMVNHAAVDVAEREIIQQVIVGRDAQFLLEQLGTLGSHAVQVLYVGVAQVRHCSTGIRQAPGPSGA